ncbi:LINE-1 reverse transcriptase-like [Vitis vinifera]|uniref:LINE-1 reverse transcriptase-like n=1 Tax=Vitis vinifera TaxID=29760 RepID=A0A438FGY6_VITVI|nr:LINE-1 reverse transcriptase-like [Vitis vinifera]
MEGSRLEDCLMSEDGTQSQVSGSGQNPDPNRSEDGLGLLGQASSSSGPKDFTSTGPSSFGLVFYGNGNGKPKEKAGPLGLLKRDGLAFRSSSPPASSKAQTEKGFSAMVRSRGPLRSPGVGISNCWGKDDQWGLRCGDETEWGGSPAPIALCWRKTQVESIKEDCLCKEIGHSQQFAGKCWDLVEISNDSMEDDRKALCLARPISQEEGAWVDEGWEESELARFSHFLGFSTEGLEKDILEFMVKIRKRRERIHSKAMLEKSKFERELRRLECSVNYEGGKKRKGRFLDWGALEAQGTAGGILICWDKRTLEILEMEMGQFTISCRLRNVEDGKTWIFTGVYGPFSKDDRDTFWGSLGRLGESGMILGVLGGSVWEGGSQQKSSLQQVEFWDRVESGRSLTERESELKTEAKEAFKNWVLLEETHWRQSSRELWRKDQSWKSDIEGLQLKSLNHAEAEARWVHSGLLAVLLEFVKEEIVDVFKEFYEDKSFAKSLNSTFLVLIQERGAEDLGDFRPISLLGVCISSWPKCCPIELRVLDKVVSPDQNAFVKGRQILDASLIANEVIDYWLKRKEKGVICKLDIEKAYDSINWNFLMKVMRKMGFGDRWLKWIWWCISTASFSILVNGCRLVISPTLGGYAKVIHSPLPFVLGMEVLSAMLRRAVDGASFQVEDIEMLAVELGCKVGTSLRFIWGCLWEPSIRTAMWDGVEARMRRRLALWKRQYLSKGGRITLIKSTLASMPIYQLSLFRMPKLVVKSLKSFKGTFFGRGKFGKKDSSYQLGGDSFWRKVVGVKYGRLGFGWRTKEAAERLGWGFLEGYLEGVVLVLDNIEFKVGKGTKVSFWTDHWCGNEELAQTFPQLFELAVQRNASVNEMWDSSLGQGVVRALWEIVLALFGANWVFPKKVKDMLVSWRALLWEKEEKDLDFHSAVYFWTVWKERNRLAFRGGSLAIQKLKNSFVCNLWSWARVYMGEESSSLIGFLEWLATP